MKKIIVIFCMCMASLMAHTQTIDQVEYWFDDGFASRTQIPITPIATFHLSELNTSGLDVGLHTAHIRAKDNNEQWSVVHSQSFYKCPVLGGGLSIVEYEYWLDDNFNGRTIQTTSSQPLVLNNFNLSDCPKGLHIFHIRAKDNNGRWSTVHSQNFYKTAVTEAGNKIDAYRYWFNNDFAGRKDITLPTPVTPYELTTVSVASASLTDNASHTFHVQFRDLTGQWSTVYSSTFTKGEMITLNVSELNALKDLYQATGGSSWTNTLNNDHAWDLVHDGTVYDWYGLSASSGHITSIDLNNNKLSGNIPSSLANLSQLQSLNLRGNRIERISATIPATVSLDISGQVFRRGMISPSNTGFTIPIPQICRYRHAEGDAEGQPSFDIDWYGIIIGSVQAINGNAEIPAGISSSFGSGDSLIMIQTSGDAIHTRIVYHIDSSAAERISGRVADFDNDVAIPNGTVMIYQKSTNNVGALVDSLDFRNGLFNSRSLPSGEYIARAMADGYFSGYYTTTIDKFAPIEWSNASNITLPGNTLFNIKLQKVIVAIPNPGHTISFSGKVESNGIKTSTVKAIMARPVAHATIILYGKNKTKSTSSSFSNWHENDEYPYLIAQTQTDENGNFSFHNIPKDNSYMIKVEIPGYELTIPHTVNPAIEGDEVLNLNYLIDEHAKSITAVARVSSSPPIDILPVSIYPNPAVDMIHIVADFDKPYVVKIYNALGQLVLLTHGIQEITIDISKFSPGIYYIRIANSSNTSTHKIIKQ